MDFTREPIIETIITPREGYRLVVRSSKSMGQEEYFVDAIEVVCFGKAFFFRSTERPKPFLVPVNDYEILEVREQRLVLKTAAIEGSVKIAGGREANHRAPREDNRREPRKESHTASEAPSEEGPQSETRSAASDGRGADRRRDKRRGGTFRRRRGGRDEAGQEATGQEAMQDEFGATVSEEITDAALSSSPAQEGLDPPAPRMMDQGMPSGERERERGRARKPAPPTGSEMLSTTTFLRSVLPPPTTLIRDDLERLRGNDAYRGAFFVREGKEELQDDTDVAVEDMHGENREREREFLPPQSSYEEKGVSFEEEPFLFSSSHEKEVQRDAPTDIA